jgi:hypothetical protein
MATLTGHGLVALVNVQSASVVWFLGDATASLDELVSATHHLPAADDFGVFAHGGYLIGCVRRPYVLVLEVRSTLPVDSDLVDAVVGVCSSLEPHMPSTACGDAPPTGNMPPPGGAQGPAGGAAPAHAVAWSPEYHRTPKQGAA